MALTVDRRPDELLAQRLIAGGDRAAARCCSSRSLYPRGMGMGDVKLAAVMGLFLGRAVAPALLIGFAAGAIYGVALIARAGPEARKQAVPFGPFLALGGVVGAARRRRDRRLVPGQLLLAAEDRLSGRDPPK